MIKHERCQQRSWSLHLAAPRTQIGTGWTNYTFAALADWNGDGNPDIITRDAAGTLWQYTGTGTNSGTNGRVQISTGW